MKIDGFKASANMISNGIMGFYFFGERLHYTDRHRNAECAKSILLNDDEMDIFNKLLNDINNEEGRHRLSGTVVTLIKYLRKFKRERICDTSNFK